MDIGLKCIYAITNCEHSFGPFADGWTDRKNEDSVHTKETIKKKEKKRMFQIKSTSNDDFLKYQWCWTI
tara:strand:+ start:2672 stop:2878 length:207 start_codon:yes stop_codon:yes gene_type:complete